MPKHIMSSSITIALQTSLEGQAASAFFNFLDAHKKQGISYFEEGSRYPFQGHYVDVQHDFFCRSAEENTYVCDFIGQEIGRGGFAIVVALDKTIKVGPLQYIQDLSAQLNVLKIQRHCSCDGEKKSTPCTTHNSKHMLQSEYTHSAKVAHLHMHPPVHDIDRTSYTLLARIPGRELFYIITDDLVEPIKSLYFINSTEDMKDIDLENLYQYLSSRTTPNQSDLCIIYNENVYFYSFNQKKYCFFSPEKSLLIKAYLATIPDGLTTFTDNSFLAANKDDISFIHRQLAERELSLQERIKLTRGVITAVHSQVRALGLIHGDVKPENMLVSLDEPENVKLIDYGFAVEIPKDPSRACLIYNRGTEKYMPDEAINKLTRFFRTPAHDIFSLGRVLTLIWGGSDASYTCHSVDYLRLLQKNRQLHHLFRGIPPVQQDQLAHMLLDHPIRTLIKKMLSQSPEQRGTIDNILVEFQSIERLFTQQMARPPETSPAGSMYSLFKSKQPLPTEQGGARSFSASLP